MAELKNTNRPKVTGQDVLQKRLGVGPAEYQAIERGTESIKGSAGRVFKGTLDALGGAQSIIGMAKDNIFEFPVFVSDTVPLEYATATNTLLEQVYASYLQMALTLNPIISSKEAAKGVPFSKFKSNITKYIECVDLSYQKDACHALYQNDEMTMEFHLAAIEDKDAKYINEYCAREPLSEFDHYFQEAVSGRGNPATGRGSTLSDAQLAEHDAAELAEMINRANKTAEELLKLQRENAASEESHRFQQNLATERNAMNDASQRANQITQQLRDAVGPERQRLTEELAQAQQDFIDAQARFQRTVNTETPGMLTPEYRKLKADMVKTSEQIKELQNKNATFASSERRAQEKHAADMKTKAPQQIDETKLNKLNTMKPLMMVVNLSVMDKEGGVSRPIEYMVGVKTHCRIIDSNTLPEVVKYPVREMDKYSRKAKWKAGELKFFKDIVFDIKGKKQTAIDSSDPKKKWYRRLYQLSHMKGDAPTARAIGGRRGVGDGGLIPNVTMVLTQSDVNRIEDETGIDMMKPTNAQNFCKELFMMGIVIIDIDSESIKLLFPDINNDYEVQSLAAVNKQIAQLDTAGAKTKDIFKMLG